MMANYEQNLSLMNGTKSIIMHRTGTDYTVKGTKAGLERKRPAEDQENRGQVRKSTHFDGSSKFTKFSGLGKFMLSKD